MPYRLVTWMTDMLYRPSQTYTWFIDLAYEMYSHIIVIYEESQVGQRRKILARPSQHCLALKSDFILTSKHLVL